MAANNNIVRSLTVKPAINGRFEVRDGDQLLGSSASEMAAVWQAVSVAQELALSGFAVRVMTYRDGEPIEQFVAKGSAGG